MRQSSFVYTTITRYMRVSDILMILLKLMVVRLVKVRPDYRQGMIYKLDLENAGDMAIEVEFEVNNEAE